MSLYYLILWNQVVFFKNTSKRIMSIYAPLDKVLRYISFKWIFFSTELLSILYKMTNFHNFSFHKHDIEREIIVFISDNSVIKLKCDNNYKGYLLIRQFKCDRFLPSQILSSRWTDWLFWFLLFDYELNFQVTYWWLNWLMSLGYKRPLEMSDLGALPLIHESSYNHNKFRDAFEKEKVSEF